MAQERSAGAVIFRKEDGEIKYLLLHYKYKTEYWDFPKGNVEEGEDEKETAQREAKEETGLEIDFVSGFEEKVSWFYKRGGETIFKETVYFLAEAKEGEAKVSEEHLGYGWFSYEKAFGKIKFKNSKEVLKKAHLFLSK